MNIRKTTAAALALTLLMGTFAACGDSEVNAPEETTESPSVTPAVEEEPAETEIPLPEADYNGYEVRVLNNISNFAYTNIGEEGLTGEALDDAIFNRNKTVEDELNITFNIEKREYYDTNATIQKVVSAGEDTYDFYTCDLNILLGHAMSGYDLNVLTVDSLDFDKPWWNKQAIDSVSIGDAVYGFFGDLHTGYFESHNTIVFNKDILTDLNLEDPYELVHNDEWTLDKMIGMMDAAKMDKDGDGKWTVEDQYGFSMYEGNWSLAFITGADEYIVQKDENNLPVWNGLSDRFISVYERVATGVFGNNTNNALKAQGTLPGELELYRLMFIYNRVLFLVTQLGVLKNMRDVEFELGVVPSPKFDDLQKNYVSLIFQGANAVGIPMTNPDAERTGLVLEYMAARSTDTVRDVYMNQTLDFKYIQDEESQEMLDIILSTGTFDIASVYNWGSFAGQVMTVLNAGRSDTIASIAAKFGKKITADMEKTLETFAEVGR
ncbi:MAG: hypothetical protein E7576_04495 [Ruminococcaceae bacterium]|jgi:hypothetical protein|nr:hypothetical protein [Oscillospiraceae bacterium]